ncbi:MAG TPA: LysM domain-containing protein [Pelolinea sp.]|nr:LysM domain-containing protein [Pelolinea sp.]
MKWKPFALLTLSVLAGCTPAISEPSAGTARLTPYLTSTGFPLATAAMTKAPQPTALPSPTPTPVTHVVALGETISSIALRYGLDMGAVLAANPQVDPYTLTVGTEVIIPLGDTSAQIGLSSEPLALEVSIPVCTPTAESGLWCIALITNPLAEPAAGVTVAMSLLDGTGEETARLNAPMLLNKIEADDTLPAMAYFPPPVPEGFSAASLLVSALPLAESGKSFLPAVVLNEEIQLDGRTVRVSGEVTVEGESGAPIEIWVAALAYDSQGRLVGVRRLKNRISLETGNDVDFNLNLYSMGAAISHVIIKAEALQINQ